jgi:hypothetical protein
VQSAVGKFLIEVTVVWRGNKWFDCTMDDMTFVFSRLHNFPS